MNIQLHITLYEEEGEPRFKVFAYDEDLKDTAEVTEQYDMMAATEPGTGRQGFTLMKKDVVRNG